MKTQDIILRLDNLAKAKNLTADQQKELESIIRTIDLNNQIENGKQLLYLILKILTGSDDFPDFLN
jgi:hypothetical protein